jgi:hypothetical protein
VLKLCWYERSAAIRNPIDDSAITKDITFRKDFMLFLPGPHAAFMGGPLSEDHAIGAQLERIHGKALTDSTQNSSNR